MKWLRATMLFLLITVAALVAEAAPDGQRPIFSVQYETREVTSGIAGLNAEGPAASEAMVIECSNARFGQCSQRSRVCMDDRYISGGAHRSEASTSQIPETLYGPDDRLRYRFSIFIDAHWIVDTRDAIDSVWQFKRFDSKPDMFVAIKGNSLVWRITDQKQITLAETLPVGRWLDFDFKVLWSRSQKGRVELITTDTSTGQQKIFQYEGPNLRDDRPKGGYLKWGIYKPGQLQRATPFPCRSVLHDAIEVYRWN